MTKGSVLWLKSQYMGTILEMSMWVGGYIFSPSLPFGCFALSLCLLLAVGESGRKQECFLARGSRCCLGDCSAAISENLRSLIHHHPRLPRQASWGSDLIRRRAEYRPVLQTWPRRKYSSRCLLQKICFLAVLQHFNICQKCLCAAAFTSPLLFSYLGGNGFTVCVH